MAVSREIEENAMIRYFKTDNQRIQEEEKIGDGVWVQMLQPTHQECAEIAEVLNVDIEDIQAALDEEESSRIELQDGYTLILVDIPTVEIRHEKQSYTTIPLGIILTQDVRGQGKKGQLIDAAEGYARNFLLPRKLAVLATADAINTMNLKEKARRAEEAANRQAAVEMGAKLKNVTVKLTAKGGKEGKLFGAITSKEISEGLMSQFQLDVPKQKIVLDEPIKAYGTYEVKAKLGYEVSAKFSVSVSEE